MATVAFPSAITASFCMSEPDPQSRVLFLPVHGRPLQRTDASMDGHGRSKGQTDRQTRPWPCTPPSRDRACNDMPRFPADKTRGPRMSTSKKPTSQQESKNKPTTNMNTQRTTRQQGKRVESKTLPKIQCLFFL